MIIMQFAANVSRFRNQFASCAAMAADP